MGVWTGRKSHLSPSQEIYHLIDDLMTTSVSGEGCRCDSKRRIRHIRVALVTDVVGAIWDLTATGDKGDTGDR